MVAEETFENPDIRGYQDDDRKFTEAINEIRSAEGEDAAHMVSMHAADEAR